MIRICKPDSAPSVLFERGAALTAELCARVEAGEAISSDLFKREVYGAAEVKEALRVAQHDKCCFCEAKLGHAQFGDVEHFRPKASAQQSADDPPTTGYYWLAYTWKNLYLSCAICNQRHKRCLFPLANPEQRVSSHHRAADLDVEQPLFVDPGARTRRRSSSTAESTQLLWRGTRAGWRPSRPFSSIALLWWSVVVNAASSCVSA